MQRASPSLGVDQVRLRSFGSPARGEGTARLHPLETTLLAIVSLHLLVLPWALGGMHVWSQCLSLGLGVFSLLVAVQPRRYARSHAGGNPFRLHTLPRLLHFPIFWLGLAFLAFIAVQGLNPAWNYVPIPGGHWLQGISHVRWLPSGMRTPLAEASPWRSLLIDGSAWLSVCAVWTGFTRRRALRILLAVLAANAFLLAMLGLLQRASGASRIFWSWQPPAEYFVASFIYRNHAGAYFNLMLSVCCALAFWWRERSLRSGTRSSPAIIFAFFAAAVAEIVLCSYSRGSILLMVPFLAIVAGLALRRAWGRRASGHSFLPTVALGVALAAVLGLGVFALAGHRTAERMEDLRREIKSGAANTRVLLDEATWAMADDQLATGWGAGSFRYVFRGYQARYPGIMIAPDSHRPMLFEHASNDYLELLAEGGICGTGLLAAGLAYYLVRLQRLRAWRNPLALILLLGCLVTMIHAGFDFPLANPAVLLTWCCLWPIALRWLEIESQRAPPPP